jgi:hypothetical protein
MQRHLTKAIAIATVSLSASALGSLLAPGSTIATTGTDAIASPGAYGTLVHNQIDNFQIFHATGALLFSGKLESSVIMNSVGQLTFDLAIIQSENGLNGIVETVSRNHFASWVTDVDWRADAPGMKAPASAKRSGSGDMIKWEPDWNGTSGIFSGETSRMLFAATDASMFAVQSGLARITLTSGEWVDIEVAAPVPAPGALALLGLAGCIAGRRRRR